MNLNVISVNVNSLKSSDKKIEVELLLKETHPLALSPKQLSLSPKQPQSVS